MVGGLSRFARIPTVVIVAVACATLLGTRAGAPTPPPQHGLTGNYYLGARGWQTDAPPPSGAFYQVWSDQNDFMLPRTITTPAAIRVDAQVAFGQGKGFHVGQKGPTLIWWPTGYAIPQGWGYKEKPWEANHFVAAVWKGYIHLPKAGTYYFGTVSNGASAVYLNQARVALNGWGGGVLVSDAFSYPAEQAQDFVTQNSTAKDAYLADPRFQYAVPIPVVAPRDLPIEVDYDVAKSPSNWGSVALGLDLFWVTPDSPRDANGKPVASIVPSDALYTEAPGPVEKPVVRSANSTISADFLYFPARSDDFVTVTVRLADKDGNPLADKRVSISSVGTQRDDIVQPEKPTNEQGETTAKIRANQAYPAAHEATIFATDISDFVDTAQVAHVMFEQVPSTFFTDAFSPYYNRRFSVTPLPPVTGRPATIKTGLKNQSKFRANVTVTFLTTDSNIGFTNWAEIAKVKNIILQPGESKEVSTIFTPKEVTGHKCYKVDVEGRYTAMSSSGVEVFAAALPSFATLDTAALPNPPDQPVNGSQQINTLTIGPWSLPSSGGKVPLPGTPCSYEPATGTVSCGKDWNVTVNGHKIGGVNATVSQGPGSHDPHDMGKMNVHVSVSVGPFSGTVLDKTYVIPAPAVTKSYDLGNPNVPDQGLGPQYKELRHVEL